MNERRKAMDDWMGQGGSMTNPFVAHSAGAFAAATALGLAAASQWTGVMMGVMQGVMGHSAHGFDPQAAAAAKPAKAEKPMKAEKAAVAAPVVEKQGQAAKPVADAKAEKPARVTSIAAVDKLKSDARAVAVAEPAAPVVSTAPVAEGVLEPEDFHRPAEIEKPGSPDDLKLIAGVGPKLEQVLNGLGVWTYAQIAAWSPAEVAWVDDYLQFKGRIGRDDWIAQAAALASGGVEEYQKTFGKEPR
jgi:NADH-quinone oxidoreductase subunit E